MESILDKVNMARVTLKIWTNHSHNSHINMSFYIIWKRYIVYPIPSENDLNKKSQFLSAIWLNVGFLVFISAVTYCHMT